MKLSLLLGAALVLATAGAPAADVITARKIEPAAFPQLVLMLEREMQGGGRFEYVRGRERAEVERLLAEIARLLDGRVSLAELGEDEKVALINAQERANAILTRHDGERLVCERRKVVGSNMRQNVCETYAERRQRIEGTRDRSNQLNRRIQQCDENGVCVSG